MRDLSHVTEAIDLEIAEPREPDARAADMAFAMGATAAFAAANTLVPVAGGLAAVCAVVYANDLRHKYEHDPLPAVHEAVERELAAREVPAASPRWRAWLPWEALHDGEEVEVPEGLCHPTKCGFVPTRLAKYVGQAADYAHPLADGSRLHAHEWSDGTVSLHRDRLDPGRGPATASVHWLTETTEGTALGIGLALAGAVALAAFAVSA